MNEFQKFYDDLKVDNQNDAPQDIFGVLPQEPVVETPVVPEKDEEGRKNRRHRRLEEQLQKEREARLIAEAKNEARLEAKPSNDSIPMSAAWVELYGNDQKAQEAWNINVKMFDDHAKRIEEKLTADFEARQSKKSDEQNKVSQYIDSQLESLEDQFDVDLTSDTPSARKSKKEFLDLVQKFSPKDTEGNIIGYADFGATFEAYQGSRSQPETRNKEIASKSMQKSGPAMGAPKKQTPGFYGWMKDLNIQN